MKKSSIHQKAIRAVCHALWKGTLTSIPTKEDFLKEFCPKLALPYNPSRPIGGIRINKYGRPVNWGTKSAVQAQNTRRENEADRIYEDCIVIIQSELDRAKE